MIPIKSVDLAEFTLVKINEMKCCTTLVVHGKTLSKILFSTRVFGIFVLELNNFINCMQDTLIFVCYKL
jgi:hypothetical protein